MSEEPNFIDAQVGGRIRLRRQLLKVSQSDLGEAVGVTFQQIQKYERGTNRVGASRLVQIAHALSTPPSFFFEGICVDEDGEASAYEEQENIIAFLSSREGAKLASAWLRIESDSLRRTALDFIVELANKHAPAEQPQYKATKLQRSKERA